MKKIIAAALFAALGLSLAACGSSSGSSGSSQSSSGQNSGAVSSEQATGEAASITLRIGNTVSETDLQSQALNEAARRIMEETDGRIQVDVYMNSSLGDTDDLIEQALQGAAVMTVTDPSRLADYVPDMGILGMPYILNDYTEINKVIQTDIYAEWVQKLADEYGIWLVTSNWYSGERNFTLDKIVNTPADLSGQRIRTIGNDVCTTSVNAMGAIATPMSWSEVYTSIQQGALDGAEVQTNSFYATRLWEVVSTINKTGHFQLIGCVATGTAFRDSLSEEDQALIERIFTEVGSEYQEIMVKTSEEEEQEMADEYGLVVNYDVDVDAFREAAEKAYDTLGLTELRDTVYSQIAAVEN